MKKRAMILTGINFVQLACLIYVAFYQHYSVQEVIKKYQSVVADLNQLEKSNLQNAARLDVYRQSAAIQHHNLNISVRLFKIDNDIIDAFRAHRSPDALLRDRKKLSDSLIVTTSDSLHLTEDTATVPFLFPISRVSGSGSWISPRGPYDSTEHVETENCAYDRKITPSGKAWSKWSMSAIKDSAAAIGELLDYQMSNSIYWLSHVNQVCHDRDSAWNMANRWEHVAKWICTDYGLDYGDLIGVLHKRGFSGVNLDNEHDDKKKIIRDHGPNLENRNSVKRPDVPRHLSGEKCRRMRGKRFFMPPIP